MIRYSLQAINMAGDIALLAASAFVFFVFWNIFPINVFALFSFAMSIVSLREQCAWDSKTARDFLERAKEAGL